MLRFVVGRIIGAVPTLLVLVTLAFFMVRLAPGGPFSEERGLPPEIEANLRAAYHLDEPLWRQYLRYLGNLAEGDLGPSFKYKDYTVAELIGTGFPVSARLGLWAILFAATTGLLLGVIAALRRNGWVDHAVMSVALIGTVLPIFVVAPLLTLLFAVGLNWLPAGGWGGGAWRNILLPVFALALPQIAYVARLARGSLIEVLHQNYIRTARAKGLGEVVVVWRHALRAAILPVVSYLGPAVATIVTGSVVVEQIFSIPGIGRYFVQAALNRDYTLVLGVVIFYGALILVCNLLVDLIYGWLDPRVAHG